MNGSAKQLVAGLCVALSFAACTADPDSTESPRAAPASDPVGPDVIRVESALVRSFFLPSLSEFAKSDRITNVVIGTVTSAESKAVGGGDVETAVTIEVEASREAAAKSEMLTLRESGGVVPREDLRDVVAAKLSPSELAEFDRNPDQPVDLQVDAQKHSEVGQRVLVFVAGDFASVRLVEGADGTFDWYGEPLNQDWFVKLDVKEATALFGLR